MLGGEILRVSAKGLERLTGDRLVFDGPRSLDDAVRMLEDCLDGAVSVRAMGGTCVALSGGVDSCVVATAFARTQREFDAFSLVAPESALVWIAPSKL